MAKSSTRPARAPLSTGSASCSAAIELADEDGIEALTMRRLGRRLGVEAMSLYNHVTDKDDILDGMVELITAEFEVPDRRSRLEGRRSGAARSRPTRSSAATPGRAASSSRAPGPGRTVSGCWTPPSACWRVPASRCRS